MVQVILVVAALMAGQGKLAPPSQDGLVQSRVTLV
jgi:hypothetical protein